MDELSRLLAAANQAGQGYEQLVAAMLEVNSAAMDARATANQLGSEQMKAEVVMLCNIGESVSGQIIQMGLEWGEYVGHITRVKGGMS